MRLSIIGAGECSPETAALAERLGKLLASAGHTLVCGGLGGVMEAAAKGASQAGGTTIGILPGQEIAQANRYISCAVATGLGHMRNYLVVLNGDAVVAVSGGYGTLSEIALARKIGRRVIVLGGWSEIPGLVPVQTPEEVLEALEP